VVDENRVFGGRFRAHRRLKEDRGIATLAGTDLERGGEVIIKTAAAQTVSPGMQMRLEHESEVLRSIESPFLTSLIEVGREQGLLYLVMPFVSGVTLRERLAEKSRRSDNGTPLPVSDAITIGICVMAGLEEAHDKGILHRDVKPANVIVDDGIPIRQASLIDFGLARSARLSATIRDLPVGTANYMSPEQAGLLHHDVDERSDLYSAGVLLFECLVGRPPFQGGTVGEILRQHMTTDPPELRSFEPGIPHALSEIVQHLLRKDPRDRYQSAAAAAADLREVKSALERGESEPQIVIGVRDLRHTLTDPAFVGRDAELMALDTALEAAGAGEARVVLVEAQSGGGKTRLLDELSRRAAQRGFWVLRGQGLDQVGQSPLQVLDGVLREVASFSQADPELGAKIRGRLEGHADALTSAAPQLGEMLGEVASGSLGPEEHGALRTVRALAALVDSLGSEEHPALVVLDDCQWADELTLNLVRVWNREARNQDEPRHVLLVAAFRSEEVSAGHPLRQIDGALEVGLPPLGSSDVRKLLESMAGALPDQAVDLVLRLSEGSPFMAAELLRGLVESGALAADETGWQVDPELMADVQSSRRAAALLARRLEHMPEAVLRLLSTGAVLGKEFGIDAVDALATSTPREVVSALREAERRQVIWADAQGTRYVFVHDKLREALLERLSQEERRSLHLSAAERIEAHAPERVFELAYHFDAAGEGERALTHALAAAERARAQHALGIAEHQYLIAERGAAHAGGATRGRVAEGLGDVVVLRGRYDDAARYFATAYSLAADDTERARIDGKLGDLAVKRGDVTAASSSIERGLRLLGQPVPGGRVALVLMLLREVLVQILHTGLPKLFVGRRALEDTGTDLVAARLYSRLAHAYWFERGLLACGWAHLREMNLAERYPPTLELAQAYSEHAPVMTMLPYYGRGLAYAERSFEIRKALGDVWGQGQSLSFWGIGLYAASRFEEALEKFREAIRILDRTGDRWEANTAGWHVGLCLYRLGRLPEAVAISQRIHRTGVEIGDTQASGISLGPWSKASGGRLPECLIRAELERTGGDAHKTAEVLQADAVRLLADGRPAEAVDALEEAMRVVRSAGLRQEYVAPVGPWLGTALRTQLESASHWDPRGRRKLLRRARRVARASLRTARSFQNNLPHALRECGLLAAMAGRRRRARRLLDRSLAAAQRQGAEHELAQTLLARGRAGMAVGWPGAPEDLVEGRGLLRRQEGALDSEAEQEPTEVTISLLERFTAVLESGRQIASALSRQSVYSAVRHAALTLMSGERCLILEVTPGRGIEGVTSADRRSEGEYSRTIVERVLETREPVLLSDDLGDDTSDSTILARSPSVLCGPILTRGEITACFYVVHDEVAGLFGEEEERVARFIGELAGAALENAENSEERFRSFLESAPDAVVIIDPDGSMVFVNAQTERMFGYSRDELVGAPVETLLPERFRGGHAGHRQRFLADPRSRPMGAGLELSARRKDGTEFPVDILLSPMETEEGVLVSSAIRDISDRRRSEQYFQAQHAVTRALADATTVAEVMPRVLEELGRSMDWELGEFWAVDEPERVLRRGETWYAPAIDAAEFDEVSGRLTFERGAGLPGRVWSSGAPIHIADIVEGISFLPSSAAIRQGLRSAIGIPILSGTTTLGVITFFSHEMRAPDKELVELIAGLSSQVGQFIQRKRAEEEAERLKNEFFSLVSHEFRTPLTSIVGYLDLLLDDRTELTEEEHDNFLAVIKRNSVRLRRLVDDLLFISKVQSGKFALTPRNVDLMEVVSGCLEGAKPHAQQSNLSLELHAVELPPFFGDPDRLAQLFDNLISNAVKYTPEGERVEVRIANGGRQVFAEVTNTGAYLHEDDLESIFEPFVRGETATSREAPGVGLGLTIVRSIVEAHGGRISVQSLEGVGTTFRVELPRPEGADELDAMTAATS
jgi:PAS domain S-box-containing protein